MVLITSKLKMIFNAECIKEVIPVSYRRTLSDLADKPVSTTPSRPSSEEGAWPTAVSAGGPGTRPPDYLRRGLR